MDNEPNNSDELALLRWAVLTLCDAMEALDNSLPYDLPSREMTRKITEVRRRLGVDRDEDS
jgi:hypothetical protein